MYIFFQTNASQKFFLAIKQYLTSNNFMQLGIGIAKPLNTGHSWSLLVKYCPLFGCVYYLEGGRSK